MPVLGEQAGPTGSSPSGTTPFEPSPGAPAPQAPGAGAKRTRTLTAASLSGNRRCVKRRAVALRIVKHKGENQARSAVITVNGRRVRKAAGRCAAADLPRLLTPARRERNSPRRGGCV